MNMNVFKMMRSAILAGTGVVVMTMASCNPEPDESDLYTFTGETIESLIAQDSTLTAFNSILARVGYDKMMAAYGSYTCFAPTNDGVAAYCDSLYTDEECIIPYNGMVNPDSTGNYIDAQAYEALDVAGKIAWLTDSLCKNIARYHITTTYRNMVSMVGKGEVYTMLGFAFSYNSDTGETVLGGKATVLSSDNEATNGLLHIVDNVIPRYTRFIGDILERNKDSYSIFNEALKLTGLDDSLLVITKGSLTYKQLRRAQQEPVIYPAGGVGLSGSLECKVGFTLFAETDAVMAANGIHNIEELISYANNVYGNAPDWYDYMNENGLTVSTGDDYTNRFNALNMFVAYHILGASMSSNQLVYFTSSEYAHYAPDADAYDYYETMLPHTIMKIWAPTSVNRGQSIYINRYRMRNTLTDELASQGSEAMHEVVEQGAMVIRNGQLQATNGYVHPINKMLVYDRMVPKGVLNERMRFNDTSLFPELITNGFRYWTISNYGAPSSAGKSWSTDYVGIPSDYCENMVVYDDNFCFNYRPHGWLRSYQSDQCQFWGSYDFAFKLPPVPSGVYEIRVVYAPMSYGSFMQYYIGKSSRVSSMQTFGLPFDARISTDDPRIGWTDYTQEDDLGISTDIAMRNHGYMRGPYSYYGGTGVTAWTESNNGRHDSGTTIRYILGRTTLNQGTENWLRIKNLMPDVKEAPVGLDFVELVPSSVLDDQQYMEDWY